MKKNVRNTLIGVGAALAGAGAFVAGSYFLLKNMLDLAMNREVSQNSMPISRKMLAGSPEPSPFMDEVNERAQKLKNTEHETVQTVSHDGLRLVGHYFTCPNPKRVIIAMHGWRSSWNRDFGMVADFYRSSDCNVLYAEQRGQGESDGEYMGFGLLERYDVLSWIDWINDNSDVHLPIYLVGISMGATTVLMSTGFDLPENVKGVVADCGFTSPQSIWKHVAENNLRLPYGLYSAAASDLCKKKINMGAMDYSTLDAMKRCTVPILFVHGTDDSFVPIEMTYANYKACAAYKKLLVVPGAEHGMSYLVDKEKYEEAYADLWSHFDTRAF